MLRDLGKEIKIESVKCNLIGADLEISGKLGTTHLLKPRCLDLNFSSGGINISMADSSLKGDRAMAGTFIALLKKAIIGVSLGHSRVVIVTGTGSSIKILQDKLLMRLGKSHPVDKKIPSGIMCVVESSDIRQTRLKVSGINDQEVGQFASELRIKRAYSGGIHAWIEGDMSMIKKRKGGK